VLLRHDKEQIWCRLIWRTGGVRELVIHRPFVDERTPPSLSILAETPETEELVTRVEKERSP